MKRARLIDIEELVGKKVSRAFYDTESNDFTILFEDGSDLVVNATQLKSNVELDFTYEDENQIRFY